MGGVNISDNEMATRGRLRDTSDGATLTAEMLPEEELSRGPPGAVPAGAGLWGGANPSIVLHFFICIISVRTPRPPGLKVSLTPAFLSRAAGGGVWGGPRVKG